MAAGSQVGDKITDKYEKYSAQESEIVVIHRRCKENGLMRKLKIREFVYVKVCMCYAQRSKTLTEQKKRPQRVVALEK